MTGEAQRRSALVTFAPVTFDSRVRRIARLLANAGDDVMLLSGDASRPETFPTVRHVSLPGAGIGRGDLVRRLAHAAPARVAPGMAASLHRALPSSRAAIAALAEFRPHIIHANDWTTLPAAVRAAEACGARIVYDSHEIACNEHAHLMWWRLAFQPHIVAVEGRLIGKADHVLAVSEGVGQALRERYGADIRQLDVIRNLPERILRPAPRHDRPQTLVYAGLLAAERRIDAMIEALSLTTRPWRLRIIGFGQPSIIELLRRQAVALGVEDRVEWRPAVPPEDLIAALNDADIGLFLSDGARPQQRAALPNKVFEYAAAGLGLIASGSDDVASLIGAHGHGCFLPSASGAELARVIDGLDRAMVDQWRDRAAVMAARDNWAQESARLLAIYAALGAQA